MASLEENENWTDESEDDEPPTPVVSEDDDDGKLEKPKAPPKPENPPDDPNISKKTGRPKKKLSQKQLDALAKGRATRDSKRAVTKKIREGHAADKKKERDVRVVAKAKRIRKKEAIETAALELSSEDSGDDVTTGAVKRAVATKRAKGKIAARKKQPKAPAPPAQPAQPAYVFL